MSSAGDAFNSLKPKSLEGGNFFENLLSDVANFGLQGVTGGLIGYQDGKIDNGITTNIHREGRRTAVDGLKEITGAKAAEQANKDARAQFEQSKVDAENARVQAQNQVATSQMQKSNIAGAARSARVSSTNKTAGTYSLGSDEKDFLGL